MNKKFYKTLLIWVLLMFFANGMNAIAATITWDISTGSLIIPGNSKDDYIVTGSTDSYYIVVEAGYKGVITLRNVNISVSGMASPISIKGEDDCSNLTPVTIVDIILEGENILQFSSGQCVVFGEQWDYGCLDWKEELIDVIHQDCVGFEDKIGTYTIIDCVRQEERKDGYMGMVCVKWEEKIIDGWVHNVCVEEIEQWIEYTYYECVEEKEVIVEYTYQECVSWVERIEKEWVKTECVVS